MKQRIQIVGLALFCLTIALLLHRKSVLQAPLNPPATTAAEVDTMEPEATPAPVTSAVIPMKQSVPSKLEFRSEPAGAAAFSSNPARSVGAERVLGVVRKRLPKSARVEQLVQMLPTLQGEEQVFALEHATRLMSDGEYLNYRAFLLGLANSEAFRETVLLDALTRGEDVRLPTLVEMLALPSEANQQQEIRDILSAYLDHDYGPNPDNWRAPLQTWLAQIKDESL